MLDMYRMDQVFKDYQDIKKELNLYNSDTTKKEEIIVFSKSDLLDKEMKDYIVKEFLNIFKEIDSKKIFVISSAT
jgi:GTPase involved in cell partitioning and DNA repair